MEMIEKIKLCILANQETYILYFSLQIVEVQCIQSLLTTHNKINRCIILFCPDQARITSSIAVQCFNLAGQA